MECSRMVAVMRIAYKIDRKDNIDGHSTKNPQPIQNKSKHGFPIIGHDGNSLIPVM